MDNPDLNIELRLASSVSLAFIAQHELPHVALITSLSFSYLLTMGTFSLSVRNALGIILSLLFSKC